jgi:hypothetical protein
VEEYAGIFTNQIRPPMLGFDNFWIRYHQELSQNRATYANRSCPSS